MQEFSIPSSSYPVLLDVTDENDEHHGAWNMVVRGAYIRCFYRGTAIFSHFLDCVLLTPPFFFCYNDRIFDSTAIDDDPSS